MIAANRITDLGRLTTVLASAAIAASALAGCQGIFGPEYGMTSAPVVTTAEPRYSRSGRITHIERIRADQNPRFGIGTVVGTVAGGLLGHQFGGGSGQTVATIAGAAAGGAVGTLTESKLNKQDAYRITVDLRHGGTVVIVQPPDPALRRGMAVRIEGSGENARVVPG